MLTDSYFSDWVHDKFDDDRDGIFSRSAMTECSWFLI